jgi:O-antigen/teichoic acid export membrane protein
LFWFCLSVSGAFLVPGVFLEQRLCFAGRGLLTSCALAAIEIIRSVCMIAAVLLGQSLIVVFCMIPLFLAVRTIFLNFAAQRIAPLKIQKLQWNNLSGVLRESMPISLATALTSVSAVFDRIYLSRMMSVELFATVAAGSISLPVVTFLEQALVQKALPQLAEQIKQQKTKEFAKRIRSVVERIFSFSVPYSIGLFLFSSEILSVIFSGRYQESTVFFQLFSLVNLLSCIPADVVSRAAGRSVRIFLFSGLSAASTVFVFTLSFALFGAPTAIALSFAANLIVRTIFLFSDLRSLVVNIREVIPRTVFLFRTLIFTLSLVFAKVCCEFFKLSPLHTMVVAALVAASFLPKLIADGHVDIVKGKELKDETE